MNESTKRPLLFSGSDLKKLIIPLVLEQALAITVGMADTMMISGVGEAAVSGVSLVDMFNGLIIAVLSAMATGGAVVTSQYLGAEREDAACRTSKQLIVSALAITIVLSAFVMWQNRSIVSLFFGKIDADVFENASLYLLLSALSFPFLAVYNAAAALFRAMNRSGVTLKVSILMNLINVAGNAIGIYILHAGVAGVAIPSLISRAVAGIILYLLLRDQSLEVHLDRDRFRVDWDVVRKIFYIGIPSGIENGIFQLGRVLVVSIIATFGTAQIAANGVANSLDAMGCISGQAMNLAMITVIGRCVGAHDEGQVRYYTRKLLVIAYALQFVCCGTILVFLNPILRLYGLGAEATRLSWILVMIHDGMAILLWPMAFTFPNMLRSCNDVRFTMGISIFSMFMFRIVLSLIIGTMWGYGAIGVWIAMVVDWIFRILCFVWRYRSGVWKKTAGLVS